MIKISIILPVYNGAKYLSRSVESVLNQTFQDFEFIIIDDGSEDDTAQILSKFSKKDSRIRIIRNEENLGVVKSLNIGLRNANGDFIARIDADDIWRDMKLEKQLTSFRNDPDLYLSATAKININENGAERENDDYPQLYAYQEIRDNILRRNIFCHSSVVFRKEVINEVGHYNESYINSEDYEYWIRILADHKVEILEEPLVFYRISKDSISYKRLREQRWYAIKAKIAGIRIMKKSLFSFRFICEDIPYLLIPGVVYKWRSKFRKL